MKIKFSILFIAIILFTYFSLFPSNSNAGTALPLSCKVHTFLVNSTTTLPYNYSYPELGSGDTISDGDYIVYGFEVFNNTGKERLVINKVTATQLRQGLEPVDVIDTRAVGGSCNLNPENKKIVCDLNYSFAQSAHYPTEYLFRVKGAAPEFINTSTLFFVETDGGSATCASMLYLKNAEKQNPISWQTAYAKFNSSNFYIRIGDKKFYGKDPVSVHSDPGTDKTTLETSWNENGVEMRLFAYFRKIPDNMWEMYDLRTYNGNARGEWLYYKDSLGNPVKSLINYHDYSSERKFIPTTSGIDAEIYCKDCEFNAFMPQQFNLSKAGYSLQALIGLPEKEIITLTTDPNSGYGVNVLLRDEKNNIVSNQSGFTYNSKVSNPNVLDITSQNLSLGNGTCAYGILEPCPLMNFQLKGMQPGEADVTISVTRESDKVKIAETKFPVKVKSLGSTTKIEETELKRLNDQIDSVKKDLEAQKVEIKETRGVLQKIVNFISKFFGKLF